MTRLFWALGAVGCFVSAFAQAPEAWGPLSFAAVGGTLAACGIMGLGE